MAARTEAAAVEPDLDRVAVDDRAIGCLEDGILIAQPVELRIDPRELRYGAGALADEILALNRVAAQEAATLRHRELHEQGVPREVLDRMRHFSYGDAPAAHRS